MRRGIRGVGEIQPHRGVDRLTYGESDLVWDDGMVSFRGLFLRAFDGPTATEISLRYIDDYEWLMRWAGLDRATFDVHSVHRVPAGVLLRSLGHPTPEQPQSEALLRALMPLALPGHREQLSARIHEEFGGKEPIVIACEVSAADLLGPKLPPVSVDGLSRFDGVEIPAFAAPLLERFPEAHRWKIAKLWSQKEIEFSYHSWTVTIRRDGVSYRASVLTGASGLSQFKVSLGNGSMPWTVFFLHRDVDAFYGAGMPSTIVVQLEISSGAGRLLVEHDSGVRGGIIISTEPAKITLPVTWGGETLKL